LSGVSSDFRDVDNAAAAGNEQAAAALEAFVYRIVKYIGAYSMGMGGLDAIAFTGGIGENAGKVRRQICEYLAFLGIQIDEETNGKRSQEMVISTPDSRVAVLVVPTNEELMIARETLRLIRR